MIYVNRTFKLVLPEKYSFFLRGGEVWEGEGRGRLREAAERPFIERRIKRERGKCVSEVGKRTISKYQVFYNVVDFYNR